MSALRKQLACAAAACATALAAPVAADAATTALPCRAPGKVITADRTTAITFSRAEEQFGTYGCANGHRARLLDASGGLFSPTVRGGYAAWAYADEGTSGAIKRVTTIDLRTGRRRSAPVAEETAVRKITLASRNSAFWIGEVATLDASGRLGKSIWEVHRFTGEDADQLLDRSPDIDPASLAVAPNRAYWLNAGVARTAATSEP